MLIANFTASEYFGNAPFVVTFTNTSDGAYVSASWSFGDGTTSSQINPTHTYENPGNYTVSLNIVDADGNTESTYKQVVVFAIDQDETTQDLLEVFKDFSTGELAVVREYVNGSEFETDYVIRNDGEEISHADASYWLYVLNGDDINHSTNPNRITGTTFVSFIERVLTSSTKTTLALTMNPLSGSLPRPFNEVYSGGPICSQILFYDVVDYDMVSGLKYIEVDRPLPKFSNYNLFGCIFSRDIDTFENSTAVRTPHCINCVDSANTLDYMSIATDNYGLITGGSQNRGQMNYYGYNDGTGRSISVLTTYDASASTQDSYYPGSIYVNVPWVRWHRYPTESGIKLYDSVDVTTYDPETNSRFRYLRDGTDSNSKIVGKVYYDNKSIVVTDPELSTMFNYVSNRSYTLPELNVSMAASNAWTDTATTYYFTYQIFDSGGTRAQGSFGLDPDDLEPMHCRYIQTITPSVSSSINVQVNPLYGSITGTPYADGYIPHKLKILMATGSSLNVVPDADSWAYVYEAVWTGNTGGSIVNIAANPYTSGNYTSHTLFDSSGFDSSTSFIGTETIPMVYITGNYESSIFKISAVAVAKSSEFNQTQNKTWDGGSVYISEVGIYNDDNDLLMVGKLSKPIEKNPQKYVTVKLEFDI